MNSPNSCDKFQLCCTDMYLIRFLANFAGFGVLPEFHGSATSRKYQKPCIVVSYCLLATQTLVSACPTCTNSTNADNNQEQEKTPSCRCDFSGRKNIAVFKKAFFSYHPPSHQMPFPVATSLNGQQRK